MKARQKKKLRKNTLISYDMKSMPEHLDVDLWLKLIHTRGIIMWASYTGGNEPKVYPKKNKILFKIEDRKK